MAFAAAAVFLAGCETTGTVDGTRDYGSGNDSKVGLVTANISLRSDGSRLFLLNRGKATCTAVFNNVPEAGTSELKPIICNDGNSGNATVRYGPDGRASRVVYNAGLDGLGTINF